MVVAAMNNYSTARCYVYSKYEFIRIQVVL